MNFQREIAPQTKLGCRPLTFIWQDYEWFNYLPKDTYFALWLRIPSLSTTEINLEPGHELYVVSFHFEHLDIDWLINQCKTIKQPIIVLNDGSDYNFPWPSNIHFYNYYSWHIHLNQIITWFPEKKPRNLKYKISAVCNRITQSKLLVTTTILENMSKEEILVKLGTWLEEKNVHYRQPTGIKKLDDLADIFYRKYFGLEILIDDFKDSTHNFQRVNSNPWQPLYLESAIHCTNQSYHYSKMIDHIRPGPTIDEKTFKCLLTETPFISVGQFDVYNQLTQLGLKFDYGVIDLSWDSDPGNLTRLSSIIDTIIKLKNYSIDDIDNMTQESSKHNAEQIWSGKFSRSCQQHNITVAEEILKKFS